MPQKGQISQIKILSEIQEDEIRHEYFNGPNKVSYRYLANQYGVSPDSIKRAIDNSCERSGKRAAKKLGLYDRAYRTN